jgi:hypothetical protein
MVAALVGGYQIGWMSSRVNEPKKHRFGLLPGALPPYGYESLRTEEKPASRSESISLSKED